MLNRFRFLLRPLFILCLTITLGSCGGDDSVRFNVTDVVVLVDNPNFNGQCPHDYRFSASITTNGGGPITFIWERTTGDSPQDTAVISTAGVLIIQDIVTATTTGNITVRMRILSPNSIVSNDVTVTTNCQ